MLMIHNLKAYFSAVIILLTALLACVSAVNAEPTIDLSKKGSITLNKTTVDGQTNVNNVEFSLIKIGDMQQRTYEDETGTQLTQLFYSLNDAGKILYPDLPSDYTDSDRTELYSAETLQFALNRATESLRKQTHSSEYDTYYPNEFYAGNGGKVERTKDGQISWTDLDLGLYLIDETDTSGVQVDGITNPTVSAPTGPFLVSIPRTKAPAEGADASTEWEYDINITAKNAVTTEHAGKIPSGEGSIVEETLANGSTKYSANIGAVFTYTVKAEIVSTTDASRYTQYVITDNIDSGVSYELNDAGDNIKNLSIRLIRVNDEGNEINRVDFITDDYTLELQKNDEDFPDKYSTFVITLTENGLAKLNDDNFVLTGSTYLEIAYGASLNENARADGSDNANTAVIDYSHANTAIEEQAKAAVTVFTYALDITKLFVAEGNNPIPNYTDVTFKLTDSKGREMYASWNGSEEEYVVNHYADESASGYVNIFSCIKRNKTDDSDYEGKIVIRGLAKDVYTLTELSTAEGYSLLQKPVEVNIEGTEGTVRIGITNEKQPMFILPLTGGSGTFIYTAGGLALIVFAGFLLMVFGRKKDD